MIRRSLALCALSLSTALAAPVPLVHVQTDKPSYRLGETVWFRVHRGEGPATPVQIRLLDPQGSEVALERARGPRPRGQLLIESSWPGGSYTLRAELDDGTLLHVQALEVFDVVHPRLQVGVKVLGDVYFPGDLVTTTFHATDLAGVPLVDQRVRYRAEFGQRVLSGWAGPTDSEGRCVVRFDVPLEARQSGSISVGVEVDDTRAAAAAPITVSTSVGRVDAFPEGGAILPGEQRLGLLVRDRDGRPTACEGRVFDDLGVCVGSFVADRRGQSALTVPYVEGRRYEVKIDRPAGIAERFALPGDTGHPLALSVIRDGDDLAVLVRARAKGKAKLRVVTEEGPVEHTLRLKGGEQPTRIVLREAKFLEVAELLVTQGERAYLRAPVVLGHLWPLAVEVLAVEGRARPGQEATVRLRVTERDRPVKAELAVSLFHSGAAAESAAWASDLAARALLQPHVHGVTQDVVGLFDAGSEQARDAYLLVQGGYAYPPAGIADDADDAEFRRLAAPMAARPLPPLPDAPTQTRESRLDALLVRAPFTRAALPRHEGTTRIERRAPVAARLASPGLDKASRKAPQDVRVPWSQVDTRDTLAWEPRLKTNSHGEGSLTFRVGHEPSQLLLAVQGLAGGAGIASASPIEEQGSFTTAVSTPAHAHVGDRLELYATVKGGEKLSLKVIAPDGVRALERTVVEVDPRVSAKTHKFLFQVERPIERGAFRVITQGELFREVQTHPITIRERAVEVRQGVAGYDGVTQTVSFSVPREARPGSTRTRARVTRWPVVAASVDGVGSMLRRPYGCFEQTTSTNYPNLVVLSCLLEHGNDAALLEQAYEMAHAGFERLKMFEHESGGFFLFPGQGHEPTAGYTAMGIVQLAHYGRVFQGRGAARLQRALDWLDAHEVEGFPAVFAALATQEAGVRWAGAERGLRYESENNYQRAVQANLVSAWTDVWPTDLPAPDVMLSELIAPLLTARGEDGSIPSEGRGLMASWQHELATETTAFAGVAFAAAGEVGAAVQVASTLTTLRRPTGGWASTQSTAQAVRALTVLVEAPRRTSETLLVTLEANGSPVAQTAIAPNRDRPVTLERALPIDVAGVELRLAFEGLGDARVDFQLGVSYLIDQPRNSPTAPYTISTRLSANQVHLDEGLSLTVALQKTGTPVAGQVTAVVPLPAGTCLDPDWLADGGTLRSVSHHAVRDGVLELYFAEPPPNLSLRIPLQQSVAGVFSTAPASVYPYYSSAQIAFAPSLELKVLPEFDLDEAAAALGLGQAGQARPPVPGGLR